MDIVLTIIQVIIALGLLNVWLLRYNKATAYRGGDAKNIKTEFAAYGLPPWSVAVVGFLKVALAVMLIVGIWVPIITQPVAAGVSVLMAGAVLMHLRINDPIRKTLPALTLLVLSLFVALL